MNIFPFTYLNLPTHIQWANGNTIDLNYSYTGEKLRMTENNQGTVSITDYVGGYQYSNGTLQHFAMSEGRVLATTSPYTYEYFYKDHLGNVRMSYKSVSGTATATQEDFYYPFGMRQPILMSGTGNKKLYNSKELVDDFGLNWYHYGIRFYDPQLGRWITMDPKHQFHSPYMYAGNNPATLMDPDGAQCIDPLTLGILTQTLSNPYTMSPVLSNFSDFTERGSKIFGITGTGVLAAGLINDACLDLPVGVSLTATGTGMIYTSNGLEFVSLAARATNKFAYDYDDPNFYSDASNYSFRQVVANIIPKVGSSEILREARELINSVGDMILSKISFAPMTDAFSTSFFNSNNQGQVTIGTIMCNGLPLSNQPN